MHYFKCMTQRNAYFASVTNWHTSSQLYKPGCAVTAALMLWTIRNSSAKRDTYSRVKQRFPDTNRKKYFTGENSSQISPTVQLLQNQSFLRARNANSVPQMDVIGQEKINKLRTKGDAVTLFPLKKRMLMIQNIDEGLFKYTKLIFI